MQKLHPKNIDDYIALQKVTDREMLEKVRSAIQSAAPDAEEVISYGMPAFKYHGMLVYFAAFKNHYSLFPGSGSCIAGLEKELAPFKTSKGTIQFTNENPLPVALIRKIVTIRMKENKLKKNK